MTVATRSEPQIARAPKGIPDVTVPESKGLTQLLTLAIDKGTPVETIEKLVALHERVADRAAAQEFAQAMAAFQAECPPIAKTSTAKIVSKRTGSTHSYSYAELDEIARTVNPILAKHGLSYTWDNAVEAKTLTCVCTVRHVNGHAVPSKITLPIDSEASMSDQQKVKAAMTFGQRCSLISALGITTADPDLDGAAVETAKKITDDQVMHIEEQIKDAGIDRARYLQYLGVSLISDIPAVNYTSALNAIEARKREKAKGGR